MNAITPEQSQSVAFEIYDQSIRLLDMAMKLQPPWGAMSRDRLMRLSRRRLKVSLREEH